MLTVQVLSGRIIIETNKPVDQCDLTFPFSTGQVYVTSLRCVPGIICSSLVDKTFRTSGHLTTFFAQRKIFLRLGCIVAKADDGLAAVVAVALRSVNSASYCPTTGLADYNAVANYYNHFMICF